MTNHKGPPPVGSCWGNTQETRVVTHTHGSHLAYTVQYDVYRGFPELRRCGSACVNGTAWKRWLLNGATQCPHPTKGGADVGNAQHGAHGGQGGAGEVARGTTVEPPGALLGSRAIDAVVRSMVDGQRMGRVAPNKPSRGGKP